MFPHCYSPLYYNFAGVIFAAVKFMLTIFFTPAIWLTSA